MEKILNLISALKKSEQLILLYHWLQMKIFKRNRIIENGSDNRIIQNHSYFFNSKITFNGQNNFIIIGSKSRVSGLKIFIQGDNNIIKIGNNCSLKEVILWMEDNNNKIQIGDATTIEPSTNLACIEGCKITIGDDCMLSSNIIITTGDSHSIIDLRGVRINPSKDIVIGNHVWVGTRAIILKGTSLMGHSIIAAGSVVNKKYETSNIVLASSPAKIVKENVDWVRERI